MADEHFIADEMDLVEDEKDLLVGRNDFVEGENDLLVRETHLVGAMNAHVRAGHDLLGAENDFVDAGKDHVPATKELRCTRQGDVSPVFSNEEAAGSSQTIVVLQITPRGVMVKGPGRETARTRGIGIGSHPLKGG